MAELTRDALRRLARLGAERRLEQIRQEEGAIRAAFPDLFTLGGRSGGQSPTAGAASDSSPRRGRRRKMSIAEKRAVSERMKKYWASRRKAR